ncbi:CehA/McbA family metallohydrolase [Sulfobacillus harzensis]|uniref:CehA/McbA family metallohydrolase n=1 Tax=Sulfobacillus harzensis TaxID=2729629 RepID=A0A7Y0Q3K9_9FIRM|nr:CehA/McbA family metallohydrolase [Sulfobacillus harzensis]NMP22279.1 CehA/McbA family metallohydrolase [Sulfobacillus harzensis]
MLNRVSLFEYRAVLHVHSRYSDGTGSPHEIIREAARAGLDILWLTDHDTRRAAMDPGAGYYGHLLFLVGAEVTPPTNHTLVLGPAQLPSPKMPLQTIIDHLMSQHALAFIAHPDDPGNPTARLPSYRWEDREITGFTGLEVWNHLSDWSRGVDSILRGLCALAHPFRALEANPLTLQLWDELGRERRVVGVGGVDAHQARVGWRKLALKIFPYRTSFNAIRTHIYTAEPLSNDWVEAERALLGALNAGRAALVNAHSGTELGFRFWAEDGEGRTALMGDEAAFKSGWRLRGLAPVPVHWEIWGNGHPMTTMTGTILDYRVDNPGVWRVVLRRGRRLDVWIYSNAIYLR